MMFLTVVNILKYRVSCCQVQHSVENIECMNYSNMTNNKSTCLSGQCGLEVAVYTLQKLKVTLTNKCSYLSCIHLLSYTLDMSKMCRMFISVSFSL